MDSAQRELGSAVAKLDPELNRKNVERVKFAKALHERCRWSVQDFAENLNKEDAGICGKTECGSSLITDAHLTRVFPNKGGSGIRIMLRESSCQFQNPVQEKKQSAPAMSRYVVNLELNI